MKIEMEPIGYVQSPRTRAENDFWGGMQSCITLSDRYEADAFEGIDTFSHVEVLFVFDKVEPSKVFTGTRHPRNNPDWPAVGIFAQRGKDRPNRIGSTICRVLRRDGRKLFVAELDAIDGTPVLDVKPVMVEFLPREDIRQPPWSRDLMSQYWDREQ